MNSFLVNVFCFCLSVSQLMIQQDTLQYNLLNCQPVNPQGDFHDNLLQDHQLSRVLNPRHCQANIHRPSQHKSPYTYLQASLPISHLFNQPKSHLSNRLNNLWPSLLFNQVVSQQKNHLHIQRCYRQYSPATNLLHNPHRSHQSYQQMSRHDSQVYNLWTIQVHTRFCNPQLNLLSSRHLIQPCNQLVSHFVSLRTNHQHSL